MKLCSKVTTATSTGCLSKAWYADNGVKYLVKGNSNINGNIGYEPISEAIAYKVATALGIKCAKSLVVPGSKFKDIKKYGIDLVSVTEQIPLTTGAQRVSAIKLMEMYCGHEVYGNYWGIYNNLKFINFEQFINMLIFDAIVGNEDRHLSNWEIDILSNGELIHVPLYDNGASLLATVPDKKLTLKFKIGHDISKPFKNTHTKQIALIKSRFPQYKVGIDIDKTWDMIRKSIIPEMELVNNINPLRCACIMKYLHNRLYHYLGMFGGVYR